MCDLRGGAADIYGDFPFDPVWELYTKRPPAAIFRKQRLVQSCWLGSFARSHSVPNKTMAALVGFRLPWSLKSVFENLGLAVVAFSKASCFGAQKIARISPQRGASFFRGQKRV